jgi:colanic acid biosynthesis glycosyl transferase WcaI
MKITLLNQCFYPDVVSSGQHLTDLGVALAERGHKVTVITSRHGYDNPRLRFAKREHWNGVDIVRLPSTALGKTARWRRAVDFATLLIVYTMRLAFTPRQDVVVALTSPPLIAFLGSLFVRIKGGRFVYWILDLNPDEALAAGWLREGSLVTRSLNWLQHFALTTSESVVALDRFMAGRLVDKGIPSDRLKIVPPWPHEDVVTFDGAGRETFRRDHQLDGKFVVMYAGNHSPCHPLKTLLEAAEKSRQRQDIAFCFVGGGSEFAAVKEFAASRDLSNIVCLSYQPRAQLAALLSAADLHVVVMGEPFVGIIHPCKIYNVMRVGSPFLYIGPPQSHVMDIVREMNGAARAYVSQHGSVEEVVRQIIAAAAQHSDSLPRTIAETQPGIGLFKMIEIVEAAQPSTSAEGRAVNEVSLRVQSQHRPLPEDRTETQLT